MINTRLKYNDLLDFLETCYDYGSARIVMVVLKRNESEETDWFLGIINAIDKEKKTFTIKNGLNRDRNVNMKDVASVEVLKRVDSIYYEIE